MYYINKVDALVEATEFEHHTLWLKYAKQTSIFFDDSSSYDVDWEQITTGDLITVGHMNKRPICVSLQYAKIQNKTVCFWHPTSQIVNYPMIQEWFNKRLNRDKYVTKINASNFHLIF